MMTVAELIEALADYGDHLPVVIEYRTDEHSKSVKLDADSIETGLVAALDDEFSVILVAYQAEAT